MKRCILLSCPCLHVRSLPSCAYAAPPPVSPSSRPASGTFRRAVADPSPPPKRHHFDLMPRTFLEFFGPFDVPCKRSDLRSDTARAAPSRPLGLPPQLRCVLGVSHPLDAFFRTCRPALFHAGTVLGLPSLRRFLPACSPVSLLALGVLLVVRPARAGSTSRMSASPGCVDIASRV